MKRILIPLLVSLMVLSFVTIPALADWTYTEDDTTASAHESIDPIWDLMMPSTDAFGEEVSIWPLMLLAQDDTIACYLVRMFDVSAGIPDQVCTGYYLIYIHTATEIPQVLEIVPIAEPLNIDVA